MNHEGPLLGFGCSPLTGTRWTSSRQPLAQQIARRASAAEDDYAQRGAGGAITRAAGNHAPASMVCAPGTKVFHAIADRLTQEVQHVSLEIADWDPRS